MKTILICNQKGGVGKSLIADELAFSFERTGTAMNFYDLDSQGGTIHKSSKTEEAQASVIDTPGALQKELGNWMQASDVIVIPCRTTSRDIEPLMRMMDAVQKNASGKPVIYVLNGFNRFRASRDFLAWFRKNIGDKTVLILPQSENFVQAGAYGKSVVEYAGKSKAAEAMLTLINEIRASAGLPGEPRKH